ncbi:leucine-rich repeat domain-containing protein [Porphyromonas circumdentaria]|uniref:leucine-rich repeat domain-containing protein n=1 Tax=Porphyromonas circumdentaria TaxID=29524 RepID=UPI0026DA82EE|nr:T9SS type A sorting domain-containing protein [Porphyromonas circumdentaria]MDO4722893.1 leucine-rich repeat domain-containing protein [Porphyromonas circumdentaria]
MNKELLKRVCTTLLMSAVVLFGLSAFTAHAENQPAVVTLKTTKALGEKIMLQITALEDDVTITGVQDDVQWENSRYIWYKVADETIVIRGSIKKIKTSTLSFSEATFENCANLQEFDAGENFFKVLDFSSCPSLQELYCGGSDKANNLEEINVSGCSELSRLYAPKNALKKINLTGCTSLEVLTCSDNKLESLDLSQATGLQSLICINNRLSSLDLTNNKALKELRCSNNRLTELSLKSCPSLKDVSCSDNQLEAIDLSENKALSSFSCYNNKLKKLDLSNNAVLSSLNCSNNQIEELILKNVTAINQIYCSDNKIKALDLKNITGAVLLECNENLLEDLDVSSIIELQTLSCSNNKLKTINLSSNKKLTDLSCANNEIVSLDLSSNKTLGTLSCAGNRIKRLDLSQNKALTSLNCSRNLLSYIDLTAQQALSELICYSNRIKYGAMAKMAEVIRNHPSHFGMKGMLYIVNGKDAEETNRCLKDHVQLFTGKNWIVFDWNSQTEVKDEAVEYTGADLLPTYTVTLKGDDWGTIVLEDEFVDLTAVEKGSILSIVATPKDDKHELKQLLAGGVDITESKTFKVEANTEVIAKFGEITSVEEVAEAGAVILYPNPATDYIEINATPYAEVLVYSMEGLLLHRGVVGAEGTLTLDTRAFNSGLYVVTVGGKALRVSVKR